MARVPSIDLRGCSSGFMLREWIAALRSHTSAPGLLFPFRDPRRPTLKQGEAPPSRDLVGLRYGKQMLLWVIAGLLFAIFVMQVMGAGAGGSWIYGYFLEYMLSMDNLFVFQLVFKAYATPEPQVDRALFWGIAAAVVLRLAFFAVGTEILQLGILARIFFGLLLVYSGWKAAWQQRHGHVVGGLPSQGVGCSKAFSDSDEEEDPSKNLLVRCVARLLPLHDKYSDEPAFFVRVPRRTSTDLADHTAPAPSVVGASGGDGDGIRLCPDTACSEPMTATIFNVGGPSCHSNQRTPASGPPLSFAE